VPSDRYSHGHHDSVLRSHRWRTAANSAGFLIPRLAPGDEILDVGCGPGTITADLATLVPNGRVLGVDRAEGIVEAARAEHAGVANLAFEVADVYALAWAEASFDVVYAHQVLQHLSEPVAALGEMRRVLRLGGTLAVRDGDYGSFAWFPEDNALTRWMALYHEITARNGACADAGRRLPAWVREAGFSEIEVSSSNWTLHTDEERRWWGESWADRALESEFAVQAIEYGLSTSEELASIAEAFRRWAASEDGLFVVPSVEVLARR
jgi:SAM-dependent methyltransferase